MRPAPLLILGSLAATAAAAQAVDPLGLGVRPVETLPIGDPLRGHDIAMGGVIDDLGRVSCALCHGLDGAGDPAGAFPRLAGQSEWYLYKALTDFAEGRRPHEVMMPIAQTLTDLEMRNVATYYASLVDVPAFPPPERDPDLLQQGGAIAAVGGLGGNVPACSGCHGENGEGEAPIYPALAGQSAPYIELQLRLWRTGLREGDPGDVMEHIANALTEEQITQVAAYYAALPPLRADTETAGVPPEPAP